MFVFSSGFIVISLGMAALTKRQTITYLKSKPWVICKGFYMMCCNIAVITTTILTSIFVTLKNRLTPFFIIGRFVAHFIWFTNSTFPIVMFRASKIPNHSFIPAYNKATFSFIPRLLSLLKNSTYWIFLSEIAYFISGFSRKSRSQQGYGIALMTTKSSLSNTVLIDKENFSTYQANGRIFGFFCINHNLITL